jgi:hypothetical protein
MALGQGGAVTGGRRRQLRYGPYIGERARRSLPSLYARRDEEEQFQQELALQREQMRLAEKAQRTAQGGAQDANRIALAGLGVTTLLGAERYRGLSQPAATTAITAEAAPAATSSPTAGQSDVSGLAAAESSSNQPWYSQFGDKATTWQPYAAGLGGGLLGSQIGGQIAGRKRRREGKIAGGAIGGGAAGASGGGGLYGGIIGAVVGGAIGAFI